MKKTLIMIILALALLLGACRAEPTPAPAPVVAEPAATPIPASPEPAPTPTEAPTPDTGEVTALQDLQSATIRIQADGSFCDPDGYEYSSTSSGSGFIIDPKGIAVTNNHVVEGAAILQVWVGGESESRNARILGVSECADLAVIDIEGDGFPYLTWYEGEISPGLTVYAAGYPHGEPEYTLSQGIVTRAETDGETDWASVDSAMQHQAPIANGSSGGPLVTEEGQVVAVNYASGEDALEFLAITGPQALPILEKLRADEDVDSIGINPKAVAFEDGLNGIWVSSVRAGSPADKAGVEAGDLITRMAGLSFLTDETLDGYTMADYCDILRTHGPEATIDLRVVRFDTEEVLEGQVNGRPLEPIFSFAGAGEEDVTETEETYSDYVKLEDDTGAIQLEAPDSWDDVDGSPMLEDDGTPYAASILAASDLDAYKNYQAPGVRFAALPTTPGELTPEKVLATFDYGDDCEYVGREPYSDNLYEGAYDHYTNCGGAGIALFVVAAFPEDLTYVNVLIIQALTDADLDAADHVLATFQVVGDLPGSGQGTGTEPPSGAEPPSGSEAPSGESIAITVANRTPESICAIYIVPSDTEDWGENWLGSDPLVSGSYWSDYLDAGVTHQLYAADCTEAVLGAEWEIDDNTVVTFGATGRTVNLFFDNQTDAKICEIYASPSTSDDWGDNLLGPDDTHVKPDSFWRFWLEPGTYDLLARDCDGQDLEQYDEVDLSEDRSWTLGGDEEGSQGNEFMITVYNESPSFICSVFIAPTDSDEWGENRLGENEIHSGEWREFAVEAGGTYDVVARDCRDAYLGALWEVEEAKILTIGGPGRTTYLLVENGLDIDVCEIHLSPVEEDDWGENWLQEEGAVITAGTAWALWLKPGIYDVLARDCQGEDLERFDGADITNNLRWGIPQQ